MPTTTRTVVRMRPRAFAATAALAPTIAIVLLGGARPAAAAVEPALIATQPAANAVLTRAPTQLVLDGPGPLDARAAQVVVSDASHRTVATAPAQRAPGNPAELTVALPRLDRGTYTVVWRLGDPTAGTSGGQGSFAFAVDAASPALVQQEQPDDTLKPAWQGIPKWLAFVFIFSFIGVLALRFLVTVPATRRAGDALRARADRVLLVLAGGLILFFIPCTLAQLANEAADPDTQVTFWQELKPGAIGDYLTGQPDGRLWLIRLCLSALAAIIVIPAAVKALNSRWEHRPSPLNLVMGVGLAAGIGELVFRVIPTKAPDNWAREIFTDLLDWGHMTSASVWIGGLVGLAVLGAFLRVPAEQRGRFWPEALRRYSFVATICLGAMILTGLWTFWLHVGPPRNLFHTLYGETLLVKLILVCILAGLGAMNQLWLLPRVNALRENGETGSALGVALRHFRRTVALEAIVGILVLLVVPFLSGSGRSQSFAAKATDLTQTAHMGSETVRFKPSGTQPGLTDYDVWAPNAGDSVTVTFRSSQLGVPASSVLATSLGGDHYRVSGIYTSIAGDWQVSVATANGATAAFSLPITAEPADPGRAPQPEIKASTWIWGTGWVLVVVLALGGAGFVSQRITRRRRASGHDRDRDRTPEPAMEGAAS